MHMYSHTYKFSLHVWFAEDILSLSEFNIFQHLKLISFPVLQCLPAKPKYISSLILHDQELIDIHKNAGALWSRSCLKKKIENEKSFIPLMLKIHLLIEAAVYQTVIVKPLCARLMRGRPAAAE